MARGITPEDWPALVSDAQIVRVTGRRTFERGLDYAANRHVLQVSVSGKGDIVSGQVLGSRSERYHTMVFAQWVGRMLHWSGTCSCPVGRDCKHTAALLITARDHALGATTDTKAWESELAALLEVPVTASVRAMALEISAVDLGRWNDAGAMGMLPLIAGKRGWNRQGASWSAVAGGALTGLVDPRVLAPLQELASMAPGGSFYYSDDRILLTQLPPHMWDVLRRSVDAGLTLTTAQHGGKDVLIALGLRAGISVRLEDDGAAVVSPTLDLSEVEALADGGPHTLASAPASLGEPVHAFWAARADGALVLMPLEPAPSPALGRLLAAPDQRVVVPAPDVPRFEAEHLEALATAIPVLAIDPRLHVPEPAHVVAVLHVEVDGERHRAATRWTLRYVTASGQVRREVDPGAPGSAPGRDIAGELQLAARVASALAGLEPGLVAGREVAVGSPGSGIGVSGRLSGVLGENDAPGRAAGLGILAVHTYAGMDTARFMTEVVPVLRALEDVIVEVAGAVPDYHEAQDTPLVTTDVDEGESPDWFSLHVRVRVGSEEVPLERLMHAVAAHEDEVLLDSGTWVDVATPEIERLAALMEEGRHLADPTRRSDPGSFAVTAFQAGYYAELVALGVVGESARRWRESVDRLLAAAAAAQGGRGGDATGGGARHGECSRVDGGAAGEAHGGVDEGGDRGPTGEAGAGAEGPAVAVDVAPPAGLLAQLRPYQLEGYRWLHLLRSAGLGGVLADDMGLGKTVQVLAVVQRLVEARDADPAGTQEGDAAVVDSGPVLVVAPTSVVGSWVEQAVRFCPGLRVRALTRTAAKRGTTLAQEAEGADLLVTSYTIVRLEEDFTSVDFSWVVLDEAQFVKNHTSATYKAVRRLRSPSTVAITGTPLENSLMDLWSLLSIAAPGLLPGPERFTELYRRPIDKGDSERLASLRARMRPFLLRRTKEEVAADLPSKTEQVLSVELGARHRRAYEQRLIRERQKVLGLLEDDSATARFSALKSLTILRQMALDPALVGDAEGGAGVGAGGVGAGGAGRTGRGSRTAKVEVLLEQLTAITAEGHRALVFSQFTRYLRGVREELDAAGLRTTYLDGTTSDRQGVIESFRRGEADVFLISLKAGGFGLTLTEADYVYLLDPWWNPQVEEQAVDRAHRIGQERPVVVYRLVSEGTIEEKVMALKEKKAELFDRVVESAASDAPADGAGRSRAALTAAEIRALIAP